MPQPHSLFPILCWPQKQNKLDIKKFITTKATTQPKQDFQNPAMKQNSNPTLHLHPHPTFLLQPCKLHRPPALHLPMPCLD